MILFSQGSGFLFPHGVCCLGAAALSQNSAKICKPPFLHIWAVRSAFLRDIMSEAVNVANTAVDNFAQQSPEDRGRATFYCRIQKWIVAKHMLSRRQWRHYNRNQNKSDEKKSHSNSMLFVSKIKENEIVTVNKGQEKQNWYFFSGGPALSWMSAVLCHKCHRCRKIV